MDFAAKHCTTNSDCYYQQQCNSHHQCEHIGPFVPDPLQIAAYIILPPLIGAANVGGLGGGIVKTPIIMLMMDFTQREATYIGYCFQFGSSLMNSFLLFFQKHPRLNRPVINFDLALILAPVVVLGTTLGQYVNAFLPELVASIGFMIFLISVTPILVKKFKKQKQTETQSAKDKLLAKDDKMEGEKSQEQQQKLSENDSSQKQNLYQIQQSEVSNSSEVVLSKSYIDQYRDQIEKEEQRQMPVGKFYLIFLSFAIAQLMVFIRGGKGCPSLMNFKLCGVGYWVTLALMPVVVIMVSLAGHYYLKLVNESKIRSGYKFDSEEIQINKSYFVKIWLSGLGAGLLTGAIGAGGGLALVTILLAIGINQRVASATSSMNNLWIGLNSIIFVLVNKSITNQQIIMFTGLAVIGGLVCTKIIYYFVEKYNKLSWVVLTVIILAQLNVFGIVFYIIKQVLEYGWNSITSLNVTICQS